MRFCRKFKSFLVLFSAAIATLSTISIAYASDVEAAPIVNGFSQRYNIIRGVGLAGAIMSLGITGILYITGNDQSAAKARTAAIYVCIAVAALYLIPTFVNMGVSWGKSHAWTPPKPFKE